jgi:hypothetical protein
VSYYNVLSSLSLGKAEEKYKVMSLWCENLIISEESCLLGYNAI